MAEYIVDGGRTSTGIELNEYDSMKVYGGGVANNTTVNEDGEMKVSGGGTANDTTVNQYGKMYISSGGTANDTTVNSRGSCDVVGEGTAFRTTVTSSGFLYATDGGKVISATATSSGGIRVSNGGTANDTTVISKGYLNIINGGVANDTTVDSRGRFYVSSGGTAYNTTVKKDGSFEVYVGGMAIGATVNEGGSCNLFIGGKANSITVSYGGSLSIKTDATVNGVEVKAGGTLILYDEGTLTGRMRFDANADVWGEGTIDFDISGISPANAALVNDVSEPALVNNLSVVQGSPLYTLTVSADTQAEGSYKLAGGAESFDKTITVKNTLGKNLGKLTLGSTTAIDGAAYTLNLSGGVLAVTIEEVENGPDEPLNNYLYDKKQDPVLNISVTDEFGTYISTTDDEIHLDRTGSVDLDGYHNHVGMGDEFDFAKITLEHGARVSFDLSATDATKFSVWSLTSGTDRKGNPTYTQKSLQATTLKMAKGATEYTAQTKNLLLEAGVYYVSMQSTNAKKGGDALYNVTLNSDTASKNYTILYDDDDGWNDYLYDRKKKDPLNPNRNSFISTDVYPYSGREVLLDSDTSHMVGETTYYNFTGFSDAADFGQFHLSSATRLCLIVNATDAATITIWKLVEGTDKKGNPTYTQKSLQATALKKDRDSGLYSVKTKGLLLEHGYYYISVQSTNAKKGGAAYYNVEVNQPECEFFFSGDFGDNNYLYDKKTAPENYNTSLCQNGISPGSEPGSLCLESGGSLDAGINIGGEYKSFSNFVGFCDEWDYAEISLSAPGILSFAVDAYSDSKAEKASPNLKFTVYSLERVVKGTKVTWKQKTLLASQTITVDKKDGYVLNAEVKKAVTVKEATSDDVKYFVSVQSVGAAKGASVYYNVRATLISSEVPAAALAMPAIDSLGISDSLSLTDALSFVQYDTDALADMSSASLADLNDKSTWQSLLA